jgi:hypothetical protein
MTATRAAAIAPKRRKRALRAHAEYPQIIDVLRALQRRNKTKPRGPRPGDRIGFSFSTRDRYLFTLQTIQSIASCSWATTTSA